MLKYFLCPDKQARPIVQCLESCPRKEGRCLALSHLIAISEQRKWEDQASVTQLIKGTRQAYLEITCDYSVEPDDMAFAMYGTLHHKRLDVINQKLEGLSEFKIYGFSEESGTLDRLEPDELAPGFFKLIDFKFVGAYSVAKALGLVSKDGTADSYEWDLQLNRYRQLLECHPALKDLFPISRMLIQATIRDSGLRQMNSWHIPARMPLIPVKKMDDLEVFYYFYDKNQALKSALAKGEIPPMCDYKERWENRRCIGGYCPVKSFCKEGSQMR